MNKTVLIATILLTSACSQRKPCPGDARRVLAIGRICDDATRTCKDYSEYVCECVGDSCPKPEAGECERLLAAPVEWSGRREALALAGDAAESGHTVDGAFTGEEWTGVEPLEGLFTNVYVANGGDGRLYFLNDWRVNQEGVRPDCLNHFQIKAGESWIDLDVYGDGHVVAKRDGVDVSNTAHGAYGFNSSPTWSRPHTIFEFSLAVDTPDLGVCCMDPVTMSSCEDLTREPMAIVMRQRDGYFEAGRAIDATAVLRLRVGELCGNGEGICAPGLRCAPAEDTSLHCVPVAVPAPDAGVPTSDAGLK